MSGSPVRGEAAQLDGIRNIFDQAGGHTEWMNEIVIEASFGGEMWRSRFRTREEALAALNSLFLKNLRARAGTNRNRKARYIEEIRLAWKAGVANWRFEVLGENYLANVAAVVKEYTYENTGHVILRLALNRVKKNMPGRRFMRTIITKN